MEKLRRIYFVNMAALSRHKKGKVCMKDNAPWDEPQDIPDNEDESPDTTISVMDESCTEQGTVINSFERFQDLSEEAE